MNGMNADVVCILLRRHVALVKRMNARIFRECAEIFSKEHAALTSEEILMLFEKLDVMKRS